MSSMDFTNLLWDDILFKKVLPYLSITDLFNLRSVSGKYRKMVEAYFVQMTVLNVTPQKLKSSRFTRHNLEILARLCSNLRKVYLSQCKLLTSKLLTDLFSCNNKITDLHLDRTANIESSCLQYVIINCKNLRVLNLNGCEWVTVGCLDALTLHHQSLQKVDLSHCAAIGCSYSLNFLLSKLRKLTHLRLGGFRCLDSTLSMICTFCRDLEWLDLSYGYSSSTKVKELIESLPKLKYLDLRNHSFLDHAHSRHTLQKFAWRHGNKIVNLSDGILLQNVRRFY